MRRGGANTRLAVRAFAVVLDERRRALAEIHEDDDDWECPPPMRELAKAVDALFLRAQDPDAERALAHRLEALFAENSRPCADEKQKAQPKIQTGGRKIPVTGHGSKFFRRLGFTPQRSPRSRP